MNRSPSARSILIVHLLGFLLMAGCRSSQVLERCRALFDGAAPAPTNAPAVSAPMPVVASPREPALPDSPKASATPELKPTAATGALSQWIHPAGLPVGMPVKLRIPETSGRSFRILVEFTPTRAPGAGRLLSNSGRVGRRGVDLFAWRGAWSMRLSQGDAVLIPGNAGAVNNPGQTKDHFTLPAMRFTRSRHSHELRYDAAAGTLRQFHNGSLVFAGTIRGRHRTAGPWLYLGGLPGQGPERRIELTLYRLEYQLL